MARQKRKASPPAESNTVNFNDYVKRKKTVSLIPKSLHQEEYIANLLDENKHIVFASGPAGTGKAQPLTAKIKVPGGWTNMGDIKVGNKVISPDGSTAVVSGVFPQGKKETFIIMLKDGRTTECCGEHLWEVFYADFWKKARVMSTYDIILFQEKHRKPLHIRLPKHEIMDDIDLPINPYLLGCLLGDGGLSVYPRIGFSTADPSMIDKLNAICSGDGVFKYKDRCDYSYRSVGNTEFVSGTLGEFKTSLQVSVNKLNLFGTKSHSKFIPDIYLRASESQKIQLLQGLLDTDGYASANNTLIYTTVSESLRDAVIYLVRSIGGQAKVSSSIPKYTYKGECKSGRTAYNITIIYHTKKNLVTLQRKQDRLRNECQYSKKRNISIKSITPSGIKECQCIMIDSVDHLYITDDYIVTHNTILAMSAGIKAFKEGLVSKIILTRPAVGVDDEQHGFLPGDINAKMAPWTRPLFDVLHEYYNPKEVARMLDEQVIEISPLAYMRGRNFKNSWIIADEMQSSTHSQMKMLLTRISNGSRMVITGDIEQTDRPGSNNGFKDILHRLEKTDASGIAVSKLTNADIHRHPVVSTVLDLYKGD